MKNAGFSIPPWLTYGVFYFASAYLGLHLATVEEVASPVWFAAGVALAGTLLHGNRVLFGVWLGGVGALLLSGFTPLLATVTAMGGVFEAFVGAFLLRRLGAACRLLQHSYSVIYFLLTITLLTPLFSILIALPSLYFSDRIPLEKLLDSGVTWWIGDATGMILITPFLLAWLPNNSTPLFRQWPEALALICATVIVSSIVFGGLLPEGSHNYPISYLPFPLLLWAALRFDQRVTTATLLLIAAFALWGTYNELGPFPRQDLTETLILLQVYIGTMGATILLVHAIVSERKQATSRLALAGKVITHSPDGIIVTDRKGIIFSANPAFFQSTGYKQSEILGKSLKQLTSIHHSPNFFTTVWEQIKSNGYWEGEIWNRNQAGEIMPQWLSINVIKDSNHNITHYLGIYSAVSRQKHIQERIHRLAYYDVLTGLPNRQLFTDRLNQAIKYAGRHTTRLALFFLDLDRFKNINDSLGHSIGDKVLQLTAERLSKCVRQTDTLARLGGDEFTIIVQDVNEDFDAILVAEKVVKAFKTPIIVDTHELFLTPSIGIALFPDDGENSEELIKHADTAMYRAKELGGNGFQFFAADMSEPVRWNLTVETALRRAIERNAIQVLYQPQFDLYNGNIVGLEALARWHYKGPEQTPPEVFIKVAEDTGLIHRLGDLILDIACHQIVVWNQQGIEGLTVAVNISPVQLKQSGFAARLRRIVEQNGALPHQIELEITEGTLMDNAELMENLLALLSVQGFQIAVDDFGTGYSSLSYLRRLSIDRIKIDKSFVKDIPHDSNDSAICSAIISMAHNLNLKVIAEGVETKEQMEYLRRERCDEIQGYIFSKPVTPEEVSEMVRQGFWHVQGRS
jgi:diguanylate cyclase (GGDEF)-like protein/PAS domain S-box-containing protein